MNKSKPKRLSIESKGKKASGRVYCSKCKYLAYCNRFPNAVNICNEAYVKGFIKGYKTSTKDHSVKQLIRKNYVSNNNRQNTRPE